MMPFIGVRISWLMLARNSLLARLAASAASLARLSSSWASRRCSSSARRVAECSRSCCSDASAMASARRLAMLHMIAIAGVVAAKIDDPEQVVLRVDERRPGLGEVVREVDARERGRDEPALQPADERGEDDDHREDRRRVRDVPAERGIRPLDGRDHRRRKERPEDAPGHLKGPGSPDLEG